MKLHILKIKEVYYRALKDGTKTFELRKNDRDFQVGDLIHFVGVDDVLKQAVTSEENELLRKRPNYYETINFGTGEVIGNLRIPFSEYIPENEVWQITYMLKDVSEYGLDKDYCILSIRRLNNVDK